MQGVQHGVAVVLGGLLCLGLMLDHGLAETRRRGRIDIQHRGFARAQSRGAPLVIDATISASAGVREAEVFCRPVGSRNFTALPMQHRGEHHYRAVVPDWLTAGTGLEYYITVTDQNGHTRSHGFVGFPLLVKLVSTRRLSQDERLDQLNETLDLLRKNRRGKMDLLESTDTQKLNEGNQ